MVAAEDARGIVSLADRLLEEHERAARPPHRGQMQTPLGRRPPEGHHGAVHLGLPKQVVERAVVRRPRARALDHETVAPVAGDVRESRQYRAVKRIREIAGRRVHHQKPEGARAPLAQPAGGQVRPVAEAVDGVEHPASRLRADDVPLVDDVGHGLGGKPRQPRDVLEGRHIGALTARILTL
jgi:hypothetical protein